MTPYYDPYSPVINWDPYDTFRVLRQHAPLYRNEDLDFYALSRFSDIREARMDVETFSSRGGVTFERMVNREAALMLIEMDPPEHTAMRSISNARFTPKALSNLKTYIQMLCCELLDPQIGSGGFDYVDDFAKPLAMMVTSQLLGLNRAQQDELRRVFDVRETILASAAPNIAAMMACENEIRASLMEVVEDRRAEPKDDLISVLVEAKIDDPTTDARPLTDTELADYCLILYSGGNSTTALLLGWVCKLLADYPDQRRLVLEEPSLRANVIEEVLRYEPISLAQGRTTTRDVELHGQVVPEGSKVLLLTGSACRDERRFCQPDVFDIRRDVGNHMAFGWGFHTCIGAHLARMQARAALDETLARFPDWWVDESRTARRISTGSRGYSHLPITF